VAELLLLDFMNASAHVVLLLSGELSTKNYKHICTHKYTLAYYIKMVRIWIQQLRHAIIRKPV
jgi:hypothetical protein